MANKTYATEWIQFAYRNLSTAKLLYGANHFELPPRDEVKEILDFAYELFDKVCEILDIKRDEVIDAR